MNEDYWVTYSGSEGEDEKMLYTDPITYNSTNDYSLNVDGYVFYYKDDEFIETILHIQEKPQQIKNFEQANNIVLSFKKSFEYAELTKN